MSANYEQTGPSCWRDTETGAFYAVQPAGEIDTAPLLVWHQQQARSHLNAVCQQRITGGIWSSATGARLLYDSELEDQLNVEGVVSDGPTEIDWWCGTEGGAYEYVHHTRLQLNQVKAEFTAHKAGLLYACRTAKTAVTAATTLEGVTAALEAGLAAVSAVP